MASDLADKNDDNIIHRRDGSLNVASQGNKIEALKLSPENVREEPRIRY